MGTNKGLPASHSPPKIWTIVVGQIRSVMVSFYAKSEMVDDTRLVVRMNRFFK